jgi:hypothetical protein
LFHHCLLHRHPATLPTARTPASSTAAPSWWPHLPPIGLYPYCNCNLLSTDNNTLDLQMNRRRTATVRRTCL